MLPTLMAQLKEEFQWIDLLPRQISAMPSWDLMKRRVFGVNPVFHHTTRQKKQEERWENIVGIIQHAPTDPRLLKINPQAPQEQRKIIPEQMKEEKASLKATCQSTQGCSAAKWREGRKTKS